MTAANPRHAAAPRHAAEPPTAVLPMADAPTAPVYLPPAEEDSLLDEGFFGAVLDDTVDAVVSRSERLEERVRHWLREPDHRLLVITGVVAFVFLVLVATAG